MSELLKLAKQLRALDDNVLAQLIRRRQALANPKDFIDLAQQLLMPKSIDTFMCSLSAGELKALRNLTELPQHQLYDLLSTGLVYIENSSVRLIEAAAELLPEKVASVAPNEAAPGNSADSAPLASIAAFETQLAITELILDAQQRQLRVVNRNSFALPDVKKLATQLHKSLDFAKHCYLISQSLGLLRSSDSRWWLTGAAKHWLEIEPIDRWQLMATGWLQSLGASAKLEIAAVIGQNQKLNSTLAQVFPLADRNLSNQLDTLASQAEWLGLAVGGKPTEALILLVNDKIDEAAQIIREHLPTPQRKLLAQGDQTLVAPGPLPTDLEILVRTFADLEQVSLASTYRISEQSVSYGLECGLSEQLIRQTLRELTSADLPQPIDYLITQATARFGRLKIAAGTGLERSILTAADAILLSEILNDQRLRPYALQPITARSLASRFEPSVLYFGLRENGYLSVLVNESGEILSPRQLISWREDLASTTKDAASELVAELRQTDARLGENPSDDDLLRQLQLAIKNRATVTVHLELRDQTTAVYVLKVSSLANGRLRGRDAKADAERVLPMSQITKIEF